MTTVERSICGLRFQIRLLVDLTIVVHYLYACQSHLGVCVVWEGGRGLDVFEVTTTSTMGKNDRSCGRNLLFLGKGS